MEIINTEKVVITPGLKTTKEFNDIIFNIKPSKKSLSLSKLENFYVYKILENTYESITFQNLNLRQTKVPLAELVRNVISSRRSASASASASTKSISIASPTIIKSPAKLKSPNINKDNSADITKVVKPPTLYEQLYQPVNNVISFAGVQIFPTIKGFDIKTLVTDTYAGGLKYYNMCLNDSTYKTNWPKRGKGRKTKVILQ
jgi:hypothetical protein